MRIVSININGIRAGYRKGFFRWLAKERADIVCIQETKAQVEQLADAITHPADYHASFNSAQKKGYSGVAIYSCTKPDKVIDRLGWAQADQEGRFMQADFGRLSVVSLYLPSGTSGDERQAIKYEFMARFEEEIKKMRRRRREFIICGDWNIAHKKIDIKNWRGNQKNSGFLPAERAWMDKVFGELGMVDAFRQVNQEAEQYTWWSNRGQSWAKNIGWRIDYQVVTPGLAGCIKTASIYKTERFSDHAPLIIEYDI